jgi:hypothetical protein
MNILQQKFIDDEQHNEHTMQNKLKIKCNAMNK